MGFSKSNSKKEVFSNTILPQETRKISNRQHLKQPEKEQKKTKTKLVEGKKS